MPPRVITVNCLLQIAGIIIAWMISGSFLKWWESGVWEAGALSRDSWIPRLRHFRQWGALAAIVIVPLGLAVASLRWSWHAGRESGVETWLTRLALIGTGCVIFANIALISKAISGPAYPRILRSE